MDERATEIAVLHTIYSSCSSFSYMYTFFFIYILLNAPSSLTDSRYTCICGNEIYISFESSQSSFRSKNVRFSAIYVTILFLLTSSAVNFQSNHECIVSRQTEFMYVKCASIEIFFRTLVTHTIRYKIENSVYTIHSCKRI